MSKRGRSRVRGAVSTNSRSSGRTNSGMSVSVSRSRSGGRSVRIPVQLLRAGGRMPADSGELKNLDTVNAAQIVAGATTGSIGLLNGVAQGTTAITRLGRRLTMKSIYVIWEGSMAATSAGSSPLRLIIVYDKQTNATAPAATDILQSDAIWDANNLGNSRRFVTLFDDIVECVGTGGPQAWFHKLYKKLNHAVEFNVGSAGTVGDIQSGSVYALMYQNGGIITAAPSMALKVRIRYSDN